MFQVLLDRVIVWLPAVERPIAEVAHGIIIAVG